MNGKPCCFVTSDIACIISESLSLNQKGSHADCFKLSVATFKAAVLTTLDTSNNYKVCLQIKTLILFFISYTDLPDFPGYLHLSITTHYEGFLVIGSCHDEPSPNYHTEEWFNKMSDSI